MAFLFHLFDMVTVFSIGFMQDLYICLYINLYLYYNVQGGAVIRQPADPKLSLHGLVYMWGVGLACKTGHIALRDQMIPLNLEILQYSDSQTLVCTITLTP